MTRTLPLRSVLLSVFFALLLTACTENGSARSDIDRLGDEDAAPSGSGDATGGSGGIDGSGGAGGMSATGGMSGTGGISFEDAGPLPSTLPCIEALKAACPTPEPSACTTQVLDGWNTLYCASGWVAHEEHDHLGNWKPHPIKTSMMLAVFAGDVLCYSLRQTILQNTDRGVSYYDAAGDTVAELRLESEGIGAPRWYGRCYEGDVKGPEVAFSPKTYLSEDQLADANPHCDTEGTCPAAIVDGSVPFPPMSDGGPSSDASTDASHDGG